MIVRVFYEYEYEYVLVIRWMCTYWETTGAGASLSVTLGCASVSNTLI